MDERFRWKYATDAEWAARVNQQWERQRLEQEAQRKAAEAKRQEDEKGDSDDAD